jgi:hypothetical protein
MTCLNLLKILKTLSSEQLATQVIVRDSKNNLFTIERVEKEELNDNWETVSDDTVTILISNII